jgi:REase_AHJR-like
MTSHSDKAQVIAKVAEDYCQRGYEVDVVPRAPRLPEFLRAFQPDLIARGPTESVVVEVTPIRNELLHGFRPKESLDVEQPRLLVQELLAEAGRGESQLSNRDGI